MVCASLWEEPYQVPCLMYSYVPLSRMASFKVESAHVDGLPNDPQVYMYVYVCMCVCENIYIYIYIYITCLMIHGYACVCVCMYIYVYIYIYIYSLPDDPHVYMCADVYIYIHTWRYCMFAQQIALRRRASWCRGPAGTQNEEALFTNTFVCIYILMFIRVHIMQKIFDLVEDSRVPENKALRALEDRGWSTNVIRRYLVGLSLRMYVCMYLGLSVRMCVCIYVSGRPQCAYVCMYACIW